MKLWRWFCLKKIVDKQIYLKLVGEKPDMDFQCSADEHSLLPFQFFSAEEIS